MGLFLGDQLGQEEEELTEFQGVILLYGWVDREGAVFGGFWGFCPLFHDFSMTSIVEMFGGGGIPLISQCQCLLRWQAFALGIYKLSFEGNAIGNPGSVGMGGIIRDSIGVPILSFSGPVGVCSINKDEMEPMRFSLHESKQLTLQNVVSGGRFSLCYLVGIGVMWSSLVFGCYICGRVG